MDTKPDTSSTATKGKRGRSFSFEFNQINFPSQPLDAFRASVSSVADGVTLWVESKKSKQQWQATIKKIDDCGPSGIPEDAVLAFLKVRCFVIK